MQIVKTSHITDFNCGDAQCNAVTQSQLMMNNLSFYYVTSREAARPQSACVNLITADWLVSAVRIHQHVMRTADYDHKEREGER